MVVTSAYSVAGFRQRAALALRDTPPIVPVGMHEHTGPSDFALNPGHDRHEFFGPDTRPKAAAVLVPIRDVDGEATVILTRRSAALRSHGGQVAFPGGRIEPEDGGPAAAALREAEEEIGLGADSVDLLGFLDCYLTGTGYHVSPVVGLVPSDFRARPDPSEVDAVFEVPLSFLMDPANHQTHARAIGGRERRFIAMPFGDHYIWGATAGMLQNLYERVYLSWHD